MAGSVVLGAFVVCCIAVCVGAAAAWQLLRTIVKRRWTTNVDLPDPAAYPTAEHVWAGEPIGLCTHATRPLRVTVSRCGAEGFSPVGSMEVPVRRQPNRLDVWKGMGWEQTADLTALCGQPGLYLATCAPVGSGDATWTSAFTVGAPSAPVVVVASTNTWHAYNDFGGLSNYTDRRTPLPLRAVAALLKLADRSFLIGDRHRFPVVPLAVARPNQAVHDDVRGVHGPERGHAVSHLVMGESRLVRHLERRGVAHSIVSDDVFARRMSLDGVRLVVCNTHAEYWSLETYARIVECRARGISVAVLSGNNGYRIVERDEHCVKVVRQITPIEQCAVLGARYDADGYLDHAPYVVTDASHWVFGGLGVATGARFGGASATTPGASGHETDKALVGVPGADAFRRVAVGANAGGPAAFLVADAADGSFLCNVGSVSFTSALDDPVVAGVVDNIVRRALQAS